MDDLNYLAGVDEVGRGALFGIVVAAAVILPPGVEPNLSRAGVRDSKTLSAKQRQQLDQVIRRIAIDCQIGIATVAEINQLNILEASLLAMERAIAQLNPLPDLCLIDGNQPLRFRELQPLPQQTIIGGDQQQVAIAAASIIAKVWRDRQMQILDHQYPGYGLAQNKGYGTLGHRQAIQTLGYSDQHRYFRVN
ncbi:MAG: ribonuclease HII [Pseudanabaenaceae cyanobacterium bins.68]|nr:ribonuclease HII [Pseudanabaenaceae cyanobacterium bins.68]